MSKLTRLEALFTQQLNKFNSEINQLRGQLRDSRAESKRMIDNLEQEIRHLNVLLHTDPSSAGAYIKQLGQFYVVIHL